ncbi:hypothetical protein GCM10027262_08700 [Nocardia tengchongensis]
MPGHVCTVTSGYTNPITCGSPAGGADLIEISAISHAGVGDPPVARYTRAGKRAGNRTVTVISKNLGVVPSKPAK